jgi:hypothetical protein
MKYKFYYFPVYVTQTIIAVTILHKIHYSIEVPKTKTDYWFSKYNRVLQQWDILYYYYSKKKARENDVTSCDVTFGYTFGHVTDVTSDDVTSGSTPFPNYDGLQVLKTVKYLKYITV